MVLNRNRAASRVHFVSDTVFNFYRWACGGGKAKRKILVSLLLFADDTVLMANSERELQKMLNIVNEYRFTFNKDKSNVMIFGKKRGTEKFYLGKDELKIVEEYKYLGVVIDQKFTWKAHLSKVKEKARKRMNALCGVGVGRGVSVKALLRGWEVLVRPVLEYGCEIWGEKIWKEGEDLQMEMGRRALGVYRTTTREVIQGELGLMRIRSRRNKILD